MSLIGHIENGTVVFDTPPDLPDGTPVRVEPIAVPAPAPNAQPVPTLLERLKDFVGVLDGLPPDAATNHDHYLYGTPKKT